MSVVSVTSCYNCGDNYIIPQGLDLDEETMCLNCKKMHIPNINKVKMPLFAFEALKRVEGEK